MKLAKAMLLGTVLVAGTAFAQEAPTDPNAIARSDLMKSQAMNIGILGKMANGDEVYDLGKAEAARAALLEASLRIEAVFMEQGAADPASAAKPEIWANWDDFLVKAKALSDATTALDVSSAENIGAGMGAIGGACTACHMANRIQR